jgi:hypothetical protein
MNLERQRLLLILSIITLLAWKDKKTTVRILQDSQLTGLGRARKGSNAIQTRYKKKICFNFESNRSGRAV